MLFTHAIPSLLLTLLTPRIPAHPAPSPPPTHFLLLPRAAHETWSIPSMHLHMMTRHSGLPGSGDWPANAKFPSTIDFALAMPGQSGLLLCRAEFANGTLPVGRETCRGGAGEENSVGFRMSEYTGLGIRRSELSFVLEVVRVGGVAGQQMITSGEVPITANNLSEPTSYLTCLLGPPFDGLRCNLHGLLSYRRELEITARTAPATLDVATLR